MILGKKIFEEILLLQSLIFFSKTGSALMFLMYDASLTNDINYYEQLFPDLQRKNILYKFYVLGQIGLSKHCRPRSDCF